MLSRINWLNSSFLILSPILVAVFLPLHVYYVGWDWRLFAMLVFYFLATGISITGGYHRLFAHRSYEARWGLKLFYLIFAPAALEGSALKWCSDHRRHHKHTDTEEDPHNIKRGFFFAHMGWVFFKDNPKYADLKAPDLKADLLVAWQDRHCFAIAIFVGFFAPTMVGLYLGSPWGGLLYGTLTRVLLTHHTTFFINSLCHMWGSQPYGDRTTARDNFIMAFLTHGEGYHNFHHRFEGDYRNGVRWYQWDPTKWWIKTLSFVGMAKNLRQVSEIDIIKARVQAVEKKLIKLGFYDSHMQELRLKIDEAQKRMVHMRRRYEELKQEISNQKDETIAQIKVEIKLAKRELKSVLAQWNDISRVRLAMAAG